MTFIKKKYVVTWKDLIVHEMRAEVLAENEDEAKRIIVDSDCVGHDVEQTREYLEQPYGQIEAVEKNKQKIALLSETIERLYLNPNAILKAYNAWKDEHGFAPTNPGDESFIKMMFANSHLVECFQCGKIGLISEMISHTLVTTDNYKSDEWACPGQCNEDYVDEFGSYLEDE